MLGYTVEEKKEKRRRNGGYRIYHCFRRFTYGKDIAEYMKYIEYLSKWDGKLPQVVTGDSGIMITVPSDGTSGKINKFFNTEGKQARIYSPRLFSFCLKLI